MLFSENHQIGMTINNMKITLDSLKLRIQNLNILNKKILFKIYLQIKKSVNKKLISMI